MRGRICTQAARRQSATAVVPTLLLALLALQCPSSAFATESCPNEALRTGFSAALPDCRAYELVSTAQTNEEDIAGGLVTADGKHMSYGTGTTEGGEFSSTGGSWVAERTPGGWLSTNMVLPGDEVEGPGGSIDGGDPEPKALSENGSRGVYITVHALSPTDTNDALDVYEGSPTSGFTWLTQNAVRGPLYGPESGLEYEGSSPDLSTVVFEAHEQLLPEAPTSLMEGETGREIYEWYEGHLRLVSVLPGQTTGAPAGAAVGSGPTNEASPNAVSTDGSKVFFESPDPAEGAQTPVQLYVRVDGERTIEVSAPAPGVTDPEGPQAATYVGATPDGTKVFFTSRGILTANAETYYDTAEVLYEYNLSTETLTAISSAPAGPEGSRVGLVGISENGEIVYFVTQGVLSGANREGKEPTENADNLYLYKKGTIAFVATLNEADGEFGGSGVWGLNNDKPADVTPNGEHLALISLNNLTEYEAGGDPEMYEYNAESGTIACGSCNVSGSPTGDGTAYALGSTAFNGTPRFMNEDGSGVFFDTTEALVPSASSGQENVYEYENGHQYLISTGSAAARFSSMTPDGSNVYFTTRQLLVPAASGENEQLYDVRVDGGLPEEKTTVCESSATPSPAFTAPGSAIFTGGENLAPPLPATPLAANPNPKSTPVTRAQKLAKALKVCKKEKNKKKKRTTCERRARKRYGDKVSKAKSSGARGGRS
jgi:hypothetical protein